MDKSTDQMTFMDEERVILVDRDDNIIGSATKRVCYPYPPAVFSS